LQRFRALREQRQVGGASRDSFEQVDAAELSPGEFSQRVRRCVEERQVRTVVIDSLNGYQAAMPAEQELILHMHELLQYLNRRGVSTFLTVAPHGLVSDSMAPVAGIFMQEGADAWWTRTVEELLPPGVKCSKCGAGADKLEREKDIVDVWFESGVSWLAMENRHGAEGKDHENIDLYLEGSDQHRGWFHSSLLAAIGVKGRAPYQQVITHGFVLDGATGTPYSKSDIAKAKAEGKKINYVEPDVVIAKSGAEMFRLWRASSGVR
jgi:hypothetical protein